MSAAQSFFATYKIQIAQGVSAVTAISLLIASFVLTSQYLGSTEGWDKIKKHVQHKIWPLTLIGSLFMFILSALYLLQEPENANALYYLLALSCLSIGLSYSALAISVIST